MKDIALKSFNKDRLRAFFEGKYYPIFVAVLVALGSISGTEYFLNLINTAALVLALCLCESIRPVIITICTYIYQVSVKNSPCYPNNSDYYFTSWRLPVSILLVAALAFGVVFYVVKNKIYKRVSFKNTPLLLPMLVFSVALLMNGAFSSRWQAKNLFFAVAHIAIYLVLFVLLYHGLEGEKSADLAKYISYISMLMAFVIAAELAALYLTGDDIFVNGAINKVGVALGWGIWNLVGVSAAVLIPMNFYGMENNKYPWLYFAAATVSFLSAVLSMSRNALLFSSIAYVACVLIFCFKGKNRRAMRFVALGGVVFAVLLAALFFDKIYAVLGDYFERGFSDNGRFNLWQSAFEAFKTSPVFGVGFTGFDVETAVFGPLPKMAHNTVLQLLMATGVFGLAAYGYYRVKSLKPFFKRPSLMKTMLGISILILLFESLLDNFVFNFYPMYYALTALAVAFRAYKEEESGEL